VKNKPVDRENYTVTRNISCNIRIYDNIKRIRWDAHVEGDEQNIFIKISKKKIGEDWKKRVLKWVSNFGMLSRRTR